MEKDDEAARAEETSRQSDSNDRQELIDEEPQQPELEVAARAAIEYVREKVFSHHKNVSEEYVIHKLNPYFTNPPKTLEQLYYRDVFKETFDNFTADKTIPYFWMPRFVNATDSSARTLDFYKEKPSLI